MQQITNTHAAKVKSPVLSLAISWLIILGTYFLLRLIFIIFGFHLYAGLLGGCLAFVPYLISTIYLYKSTRTTNIWIYLLGIALPNIIEKIVLIQFIILWLDIYYRQFCSLCIVDFHCNCVKKNQEIRTIDILAKSF